MSQVARYDIKNIAYSAVVAVLLLLAYVKNMQWLWSRWMENPNYSHGPLIPIISAYIVFTKRDTLKKTLIEPANKGIIILLAAALLYIVALRAQINFLLSYSLILALIGIIWFLYGNVILSKLAFPIIFLIFMVPFWIGAINLIGNKLKLVSSILTFKIISQLNYPIFREGVTLHLTNGSMEVADPCSGIRSLISLLALATIVAYFSKSKLAKKVFLVILVIPLAVIGNTLRIVIFALILEQTGALITEGFLHTLTGILVFVFAFFVLIAVDKWLRL